MLGFSYQVIYADSGDSENAQPAPTGNATRSNIPEPTDHQDGRNASQPKHTGEDATKSNTLEPTEHQDDENTNQPQASADNESDAYPDITKQAQNDAQTREVRPVKCSDVTFTDQYSLFSSHLQRAKVHAS